MSTIKKGILTKHNGWEVHLRDWKRVFWKGERSAVKEYVRKELKEELSPLRALPKKRGKSKRKKKTFILEYSLYWNTE